MIIRYIITIAIVVLSSSSVTNARQKFDEIVNDVNHDPSSHIPIHVLDANPTQNTIAVFYSGDGGWQDIDIQIGKNLAQAGIPVIGIDSLRYFSSERTPKQTSNDLGKIIDFYSNKMNVSKVILMGFSFGADIIPASYNRLTQVQKKKVRQISLLALSHQVDYVVSLRGWLGLKTEGKGGDPVVDLVHVNPKLVQCIYGLDERDSGCLALQQTGADVVGIQGDHHFGRRYSEVTHHILARFMSRAALVHG